MGIHMVFENRFSMLFLVDTFCLTFCPLPSAPSPFSRWTSLWAGKGNGWCHWIGDLNSGPQAEAASTFPTEPSPSPACDLFQIDFIFCSRVPRVQVSLQNLPWKCTHRPHYRRWIARSTRNFKEILGLASSEARLVKIFYFSSHSLGCICSASSFFCGAES